MKTPFSTVIAGIGIEFTAFPGICIVGANAIIHFVVFSVFSSLGNLSSSDGINRNISYVHHEIAVQLKEVVSLQ